MCSNVHIINALVFSYISQLFMFTFDGTLRTTSNLCLGLALEKGVSRVVLEECSEDRQASQWDYTIDFTFVHRGVCVCGSVTRKI